MSRGRSRQRGGRRRCPAPSPQQGSSIRNRQGFADYAVEFAGPSREGISAVARAYRDAGMRAVVAPMIADRTIYQALPGLLDAFPGGLALASCRSRCRTCRTHALSMQRHPGELGVPPPLDSPRARPDDSAAANSAGICRRRCFRSHRHDRRTHRLSGRPTLDPR